MEHLLGAEKLQRTVNCKHWIKPGATKTVATAGTGSRGGQDTGSAVAPLLLTGSCLGVHATGGGGGALTLEHFGLSHGHIMYSRYQPALERSSCLCSPNTGVTRGCHYTYL